MAHAEEEEATNIEVEVSDDENHNEVGDEVERLRLEVVGLKDLVRAAHTCKESLLAKVDEGKREVARVRMESMRTSLGLVEQVAEAYREAGELRRRVVELEEVARSRGRVEAAAEVPGITEIVATAPSKGSRDLVEEGRREEVEEEMRGSEEVEERTGGEGEEGEEGGGVVRCAVGGCMEGWKSDTAWQRKALTHFSTCHDLLVSEMVVVEEATGTRLWLEQIFEFVGQCDSPDCLAILGVKARRPTESRYEIGRHFIRHFLSCHPGGGGSFTLLVEAHRAKFDRPGAASTEGEVGHAEDQEAEDEVGPPERKRMRSGSPEF